MKKQIYLATLSVLLCSAASSFANEGEKGAEVKITIKERFTQFSSDCKSLLGKRYVQIGAVVAIGAAFVAGGYYLYNKIKAEQPNQNLV